MFFPFFGLSSGGDELGGFLSGIVFVLGLFVSVL